MPIPREPSVHLGILTTCKVPPVWPRSGIREMLLFVSHNFSLLFHFILQPTEKENCFGSLHILFGIDSSYPFASYVLFLLHVLTLASHFSILVLRLWTFCGNIYRRQQWHTNAKTSTSLKLFIITVPATCVLSVTPLL